MVMRIIDFIYIYINFYIMATLNKQTLCTYDIEQFIFTGTEN